MTERNGYQPIKTTTDNVTPPNTGSAVKPAKNAEYWYVKYKELEKENADIEQEKCELLGIIQGKDKVIAQTKELLKRVVEWADWQSGSKCPSFQDIEKDIKAFLEE